MPVAGRPVGWRRFFSRCTGCACDDLDVADNEDDDDASDDDDEIDDDDRAVTAVDNEDEEGCDD
jgi:hypothetical protein